MDRFCVSQAELLIEPRFHSPVACKAQVWPKIARPRKGLADDGTPKSRHVRPMRIAIPEFCLIALIGPRSAAKQAAAARLFAADEVLSLDAGAGSAPADHDGHEAPSSASAGAGDAMPRLLAEAAERLHARRLTVIEAPLLSRDARAPLLALARSYFARPVAISIGGRAPGAFGKLERDGFRTVHDLATVEPESLCPVERERMAEDLRQVAGPFDIIGDVHGCADELEELLARLGYRLAWRRGLPGTALDIEAPAGRQLIFLGDIVDRGPRTPDVLRIVMAANRSGCGHAVLGNHDAKFLKWLGGRNVRPSHGLAASIAQMSAEPAEFRTEVRAFLEGLPAHLWLDGGDLAVAHAGIPERMIGRHTGAVIEHCLYGDARGGVDAGGYPLRGDWAADYRGAAVVVYGHIQAPEAVWRNNTICIDTGCVFGGRLTALRWPERKLVAVQARRDYTAPKRAPT